MLASLKFVQGAVSRKDFVPELQHFRIQGGRIKSFNGTLGLCCPVASDLDIAPHGLQFLKAIQACEDETVALHVATNGKLVVRAGTFKTHVDCVDSSKYPDITPSGEIIQVPVLSNLLAALAYLEKFIAVDASRPWACGILLDNESAYATNNIVLMQYWMGFKFPRRINIPAAAVRELVRIGREPLRIQVDRRAGEDGELRDVRIIFHYDDGSWLSSQLLSTAWPPVEDIFKLDSNQHGFPAGFFEALERLAPFVDEQKRIYLLGTCMATSASPDVVGAAVELPLPDKGIYNIEQLRNLKGVARSIDFYKYPEPVPFFGEAARGIILGLRT